MNTAATKSTLLSRIEGLHQIPTIPAVLAPLLRYLEQPVEQLDVQRVTEMIAQDKSLAAQCLQMANSPLFGRWQKVDSLRGAIVGLGFLRVSDIAMSCGVLNLMPTDSTGIDPVVFWEHSLGCALVCRHFARKISYPDPGKAYLAGLLHDLGIIVNLWVLPKEFREAFEFARAEGIPLHEAEQSVLGFTHCESGRLLADKWEVAPDLREVVSLHHNLHGLRYAPRLRRVGHSHTHGASVPDTGSDPIRYPLPQACVIGFFVPIRLAFASSNCRTRCSSTSVENGLAKQS